MRLNNAARSVRRPLLAVVVGLFFGTSSLGEDSLRFGMSTALSGPAADLGRQMEAGVRAAFAEANRAGGVRGQRLELLVLDDGYEPSRTAPNMRKLIEEDRVLAVVGNVGTPTAVVAIPIANALQTPFVGAFTGAGVLRKTPPDRYVVNFRASYAQETAAIIDAIVDAGIRPEEIAFFTQRDAYGDAGFTSLTAALESVQPGASRHVAHGRYKRNTLAVEEGLAEVLLQDPEPRAVVLVGAYAPCARFIRLAREADFHPHFINLSFVGVESLARELGDEGDCVIVAQVVPHVDADLPFVSAARAALATSHAPLTAGALEGYAVGRMLLLALQRDGNPISRETLIDRLESLGRFDLGAGVPMELSRRRHQASDHVWATVIRDGHVRQTNWRDAFTSADESR